ncbi:MAG TPA: GntR family transcriptional regulator [Bacillota bacterium]|nr:GntR family transcriptional regulator [Bacillota bacterium]HPX68939.1 GntR family transcriptional regulator [Bacillota bacterium]HQA66553.1 GntR family transcriptional regulator [Bacillota bacterium]HQO42462.1 GntR family transcriptional regulator [Bacillota bacterium]HQQ43488.1 GntR family transcriptional regulator [Bacillota bacterium]
MLIDFNSEKPIYLQLAEAIEDNILKGIFEEETQIVSTTEISVKYKINPATAGKGVNVLVDEGILYKKRGLGMFVSTGAKEKILEKRRNSFYKEYVQSLLEEAAKLNISKEDIVKMIVGGNGIEDNSDKGSK